MLYYSVGKDPLPHHLIRRRGKKQFIKDMSRLHLCSSYLLLHVKHLRRDGTPNMIRLLSAILKRPGMRMLFMVTKVGYNRKKRRKAQVVSDMRERHSRSQKIPVRPLLVRRNRPGDQRRDYTP